jgi:demethylmenaquinone methyltransferase/2-methoxy-6-polyprenyl-1,4-benzoquinol methylase
MFDSIAHRYDFLNHFLSLGLDIRWRKFAVNKLNLSGGEKIIDIASGTGDFSIETRKFKPSLVLGVDVSLNMLRIFRQKALRKKVKNLNLLCAEAENLPFKDETFDVCLVAFGVRNFSDLGMGLSEIYRILKPGGKLAVLEFSLPDKTFRSVYFFYFRKILPLIGRIFSKHKDAYTYLPESVLKFPEGGSFVKILNDIGFREVKMWRLTFGVVTFYLAYK